MKRSCRVLGQKLNQLKSSSVLICVSWRSIIIIYNEYVVVKCQRFFLQPSPKSPAINIWAFTCARTSKEEDIETFPESELATQWAMVFFGQSQRCYFKTAVTVSFGGTLMFVFSDVSCGIGFLGLFFTWGPYSGTQA